MPHPIYGPAQHQLEVVTFRLSLPRKANGYLTKLEVRGECSTRRASLWSVQETWTTEEQVAGLQPSDALHHLALIALQDTPHSQEALFTQLTGEKWIQDELPL